MQHDAPACSRGVAADGGNQRPRTILVLGGGNAGKTSHCRFLIAQLLGSGERPAIVDADVGQKIVGPPATVTLGYAEGMIEQWTAPAAAFVGSTGPVGRMLPLVVGTAQLVTAADAAFVVVDTTGYIEASGRVLKSYKIDAVQPDLIVAIQKRGEPEAILRSHATYPTIRIRPSRKARPRDRWERDIVRETAFADYFRQAQRLEVKLDELIFQRSLLFTGEPVEIPGAIYAERTVEGVVAVSEEPISGTEIVKSTKPGFERNLLCGVADECNRGVGLALIESIDFGRRSVFLISPVPAGQVRVLQLGDLYIARDGRELGQLEREGL
ncbi:MAG TPA: Clp1/GlmU family protein [Hyphomicrobiaceae bacterium]|nr:Clp1/GlmU family protein [Hyphomicrobiaceae bacterium]